MLHFITDQRPGEPSLLDSHATAMLILRDLAGTVLMEVQPTVPWTHERLMALPIAQWLGDALEQGVDAYLADRWVGSTEV